MFVLRVVQEFIVTRTDQGVILLDNFVGFIRTCSYQQTLTELAR
jgi:hypothetical protein